MQTTSSGEATPLLITINIVWSIFTILLITTYYVYRRFLRLNAISKSEHTQRPVSSGAKNCPLTQGVGFKKNIIKIQNIQAM